MKNTILSFLIVAFSFQLSFAQSDSVYSRNLQTENGKTYYVVGQRAPHLFMISRDLYGTDKNWKKIANWNALKEPYELKQGQKLILNEQPTLNEQEGNRVLFQEWTKLGETERARMIMATTSAGIVEQAEDESTYENPPVVATVTQEAPMAAPAPLETKTEGEKLVSKLRRLPKVGQTPTKEQLAQEPIPQHQVAAPLPPPSEPKKTIEKKSDHQSEEAHSNWHKLIKLTATQTEVTNKEKPSGNRNNYKTAIDPGVEFELEWFHAPHRAMFFSVGYETFEVHGSDDLEVHPEHFEIFKGYLGYGFHLGPIVDLGFAVGAESMIFSHESASTLHLKSVMIPQVHILGKFKMYSGESVQVQGLLGLTALLPAKVFEDQMGTGLASQFGIQVSHKFKSGSLLYGVSARVLGQNSKSLESLQANGVGFIGWSW